MTPAQYYFLKENKNWNFERTAFYESSIHHDSRSTETIRPEMDRTPILYPGHRSEQLNTKELKRYYLADNNIASTATIKHSIQHHRNRTLEVQLSICWGTRSVQKQNRIKNRLTSFRNKNNRDNPFDGTDLAIYSRASTLNTYSEDRKTIQFSSENIIWIQGELYAFYDDSYRQRSLMAINYYSISYGNRFHKHGIKSIPITIFIIMWTALSPKTHFS